MKINCEKTNKKNLNNKEFNESKCFLEVEFYSTSFLIKFRIYTKNKNNNN